jgi:hypothetical protein
MKAAGPSMERSTWVSAAKLRVIGEVGEAQETAGVGQLVEDHDAGVAPGQRQSHEIRADEARAAGDDPAIHGQT